MAINIPIYREGPGRQAVLHAIFGTSDCFCLLLNNCDIYLKNILSHNLPPDFYFIRNNKSWGVNFFKLAVENSKGPSENRSDNAYIINVRLTLREGGGFMGLELTLR